MDSLIAVLLLLSVFGVWWLYFIEYRRYRLDATRQRLFEIRDELFAKAEEGILPVDSKAHLMVRNMLNGMIQFSHRLGFIQLVTILVADAHARNNADARRFSQELNEAIRQLPPKGQDVVKKARVQMHVAVIMHITFNSIFLTLVYSLVRLVLKPIMMWRSVSKWLLGEKKWRAIDAEVEAVGEGRAIAA